MATLIGHAVVWGLDIYGTIGAAVIIHDGTGTPDAVGIPTESNFTREADKEELYDEDGEVVGRVDYNHRMTFTITAVPCDREATPPLEATARTNQDNMLPAPGTVIHILDNNSGVTTSLHKDTSDPGGLDDPAKYILRESRLRTINNGPAIIELDLIQYEDNDIAVAVS